jgi:hypothetical protein
MGSGLLMAKSLAGQGRGLTKRAQMKWEVKGKEKNDLLLDGGRA